MGEWRIVMTLPCGCQLRQLYSPATEQHSEVRLHSTGTCSEHLCRICGSVPHGDSQLCAECLDEAVRESPEMAAAKKAQVIHGAVFALAASKASGVPDDQLDKPRVTIRELWHALQGKFPAE